MRIHLDPDEMVVDNFAGGGGASSGIEWAIQRSPDIAINHDPDAIDLHRANHPATKHYVEDIWDVDPKEAVGKRRVGLVWCSPDCKHHSHAKGSVPLDNKIRGLAWAAVRWAKDVRPRIICLENVSEFRSWGPLHETHSKGCARRKRGPKDRRPSCSVTCHYRRPIKERAGETFDEFVGELEKLGYVVEWRDLKACDFGAPTSRKRLFLVARCDGQAIVWPEPTHGPGRANPYRTAAECIDWDVPAPSIFERSKPHKPKTLARIARGVRKFVLTASKPFVVSMRGTDVSQINSSAHDVDEPLRTISAQGTHHAVVTPYLLKAKTHGGGGNEPVSVDEPLRTITASPRGEFAVATPYLVPLNHGGKGRDDRRVHSVEEPMRTTTSHGRGGTAVAIPYLVHRSNGERPEKVDADGTVHAAQAPRIYDIEEPLGTVMAQGQKHALVSAMLLKHNGGNNDRCGASGQDLRGPIDSITSRDSKSLATVRLGDVSDPEMLARARAVYAFLVRYNGKGEPEALTKPLGTLTTRDRYGLVTVEIDGESYVIVDIGMRMLTPRELFLAQGFSPDYDITAEGVRGEPLTKTAQVRCVGNSVAPPIAAAIVRAQLGLPAQITAPKQVTQKLPPAKKPAPAPPLAPIIQLPLPLPNPARSLRPVAKAEPVAIAGDRVAFYDDQGKRRVGEVVRGSGKRMLVVATRGWEWTVERKSVEVIATRMRRAA
jgi:DNA (cytosine-5)-methyltransferase 1